MCSTIRISHQNQLVDTASADSPAAFRRINRTVTATDITRETLPHGALFDLYLRLMPPSFGRIARYADATLRFLRSAYLILSRILIANHNLT